VRHLLSIEDLDRAAMERICDRAASFAEVADREIKKVPALRGRTVLNLFYEASTRTRSSFELVAKRLSADVVNFSASGSSVEKGESLKDTVLTLNAHKPDAIVIRAPWAGAAALVAQWTPAAIINAGDGKHEHPSQALLDVYTLRQRLGSLEGRRIWIVGDVLHSRVARSNALLLRTLGAEVTLVSGGAPVLRRARTSDVRAIRALVEPLTATRVLVSKDAVAYYEGLQQFRVVEDEGRVVGCGALHVMWEDLAEIRTLAVAPDQLGTGLGGRLLEVLTEATASVETATARV